MSSEKRYYVDIMTGRSLNLSTGLTNSIYQRALEHKSGEIDGFTKEYTINRLDSSEMLALIKSMNPTWQDLAGDWGQKAELQIPRFARDDNSSGESSWGLRNKESVGSSDPAILHNKNKTA